MLIYSDREFDNDSEIEYDKNTNDALENDQEDIEAEDNDVVQKLRAKLKKCEEEKREYLNGWQRERADLANARVELERDRGNFAKFAIEGLVHELLSVLDSFDMAFSNKKAWESVPADWRLGVEQIYSQMLSVLKAHGVIQFDPLGDMFDPMIHSSVASVETEDPALNHKVAEVVQKGYKLHEKVIRPASVKVGEYSKRKA
jgi:molecular chaperone GrpE